MKSFNWHLAAACFGLVILMNTNNKSTLDEFEYMSCGALIAAIIVGYLFRRRTTS